jgi:hypothetical protein
MEAVTLVAGIAVLGVGAVLALSAARKHRRERHEVENFFSTNSDEQAWWEDRR